MGVGRVSRPFLDGYSMQQTTTKKQSNFLFPLPVSYARWVSSEEGCPYFAFSLVGREREITCVLHREHNYKTTKTQPRK